MPLSWRKRSFIHNFTMDVEPLQDTVPPRHQIESDESDDEVYTSASVKRTVPNPNPDVVVDWHGPQEKPMPLLVALGEVGYQWSQGVQLGELKGRVLVDDTEAASLFTPSWSQITVVCINLRLPLYTMHTVASSLISVMRPTNVVILDAYPVPSYISSSPSPVHPPIRYLRTTAAAKTPPLPDVELFRPPNLIQSLAASLLSVLESGADATPATLLLLPSAHIPAPAPSDLGGHSGPELQEEWEPSMLALLHAIVNACLGTDSPWSILLNPERSNRVKASRRGDIGEGGMYI
ncbi:hypothetical protein K439DRAFT_221753 [Ramaria rubella]|nr:hypothetical protein K439DRAFT_221753 [Ramaria rubella]